MKHSKSNTTGIALIGCSMSSRKYLAVSSAFDELKDISAEQGKLQSARNLVPRASFPLTSGWKRELWEQPFWNNKGNNRSAHPVSPSLHLWRMPEMVAPRALDSCRKPEGSWALGTRMNMKSPWPNRIPGLLVAEKEIDERRTQTILTERLKISIYFYLIAQNNYFYLYHSYAMLQKV